MVADTLLKTYPIISDQVEKAELRVILYELEKQLQRGTKGSVVEFGCYIGTTSLFIRRLLDAYQFAGEFHVYDSFEGLPAKTPKDASAVGEQFVAGELAVSKKTFMEQFKKAGLTLPVMHKGWFTEVKPQSVPEDIMFAFFDGDFYESIRDSFRACETKFSRDACIIVDDYANEALPGAARATDEWLCAHPRSLRTEASLAIVR